MWVAATERHRMTPCRIPTAGSVARHHLQKRLVCWLAEIHFFLSSFYLRLVAKYYFCSAKAPSWIQRQGQRDDNRKDHSREGAGSRAGLAGRVWGRYPGLHLPGGRDTSGHQQDLQAGDRLLVPQGGPRSAARPKPGAEREGDRGTQSVCTRPLPLKVGGSLLQETGLSPAWGGN